MGRVADCKILQIPCPDGRENLVKYRQYLREFTGQDRWWAEGNFIKKLEEFVNLGE
jgi:hypothetical protein